MKFLLVLLLLPMGNTHALSIPITVAASIAASNAARTAAIVASRRREEERQKRCEDFKKEESFICYSKDNCIIKQVPEECD